MNELKPVITKCQDCKYESLTWHQDLKHLHKCNKCGGLLNIIADCKELGV